MTSPESFIQEYKNKSYSELLSARDKLLKEIRAFERHTYDPERDMFCPSPEVIYQCNLEYLGELCKLISKKYNQEFVWKDTGNESELPDMMDN